MHVSSIVVVAVLLVSSLVLARPTQNFKYDFRQLGSFEWRQAAFSYVGNYRDTVSLFITAFGLRDDVVSVVPDIGRKLNNVASIEPEVIATSVVWPNEAVPIPYNIFNREVVLICGGFLVPSKQTGAVVLIDVSNGTSRLYKISTDEDQFFYHQAEWYDVNNDGRLDLVSAKARFPTIGQPEGKLVWFENPGSLSASWRETFLTDGPDVFFRIYDFNNDGRDEIVATQFFTEKLTLFWNVGNFGSSADWRSRVIDDNLGAPFDVRVVDLNRDGKPDLLVTNHQSVAEDSAVFAYEVPVSDLPNGQFVRHLIANGFETLQPGANQASPGSAQAFYPWLNETSGKAHIVLAGDGAQKAYLLRPLSESTSDWNYQVDVLIDAGNTVGGISVGDVDGDGATEVFVPEYDGGRVHIITFG